MSSEFEVQVTEEFEVVQTEAAHARPAQTDMTLRIKHNSTNQKQNQKNKKQHTKQPTNNPKQAKKKH